MTREQGVGRALAASRAKFRAVQGIMKAILEVGNLGGGGWIRPGRGAGLAEASSVFS